MPDNFPQIPDESRLASVLKLCALSEPYRFDSQADALFVEAMKEIVTWHKDRSEFYRRVLEAEAFSVDSIVSQSDLARIPAIPADFFKRHEVNTLTAEQITLTLTSSGTSGQKSKIGFDDWSIKAPQAMLTRQFEHNGWSTPDTRSNYLLYTYESDNSTHLGTSYTDLFLCRYAPINRLEFALKRTGQGGHEFDVFGSIRALRDFSEDGRPVRIFGFPSFLYFTLKRMRDLREPALRLPEGSLVFLGGGWKAFANEAISKEELVKLTQETLGIVDENVRDGYGAVEHCIPYVECPRHHFHVPVWSRVFIRDLKTLSPLGFGEPGFLHFVSPYITSVPAHSVMMGDVATLHPSTGCSCGINSPYFTVLGRAGTSKNRSCAIAAAELLKGFK